MNTSWHKGMAWEPASGPTALHMHNQQAITPVVEYTCDNELDSSLVNHFIDPDIFPAYCSSSQWGSRPKGNTTEANEAQQFRRCKQHDAFWLHPSFHHHHTFKWVSPLFAWGPAQDVCYATPSVWMHMLLALVGMQRQVLVTELQTLEQWYCLCPNNSPWLSQALRCCCWPKCRLVYV